MSIGNGQLFLPVTAAIRKAIVKKEGDFIIVKLYEDKEPVIILSEILYCLKDEPVAYKNIYRPY